MPVQAGKDFLLKSDDGAGTFTTMGGLRVSNFSINAEAIDATNQGSNQWKELLSGAGIRSLTLSGNGLFSNAANEQLARTRAIAQTLNNYQISDGINTYTAQFKITKLDRSGDYKGDQNWSMTFASSGPLTVV